MNFIVITFSSFAIAGQTSSIELYSAEPEAKPIIRTTVKAEKNQHKPRILNSGKISSEAGESESGNLPGYFAVSKESEIRSKVVLSTDTKQEKLMSVRSGDTAKIEIPHSIIAFTDEKAPVVGIVKSGPLSGAKLFGNSSLEKNSKRIFIEFERVSFSGSTYELKGSAITDTGTQGFIGEYHSRESEYFAGDFISSFVAAYFDAQVPRTTNAFGQIQDDRSVDSAFKKGIAAGAMSSADRFREKLKKTPEFSEIVGPIRAQILIFEGGQRL
ncbi:MAG: hypothetical protein ACXVCP_08500 [Bdellovibrio sp.]